MSKKLVLDATPIIYLAKAGFWKYLEQLGFEAITTEAVIAEVQNGTYSETRIINELLTAKKLNVKEVQVDKISEISPADASVVLLAKKLNTILVCDDQAARVVAFAMDVKNVYSSSLIIASVKKKLITQQQGINFVDAIIKEGWYCDIETYTEIVKAITES